MAELSARVAAAGAPTLLPQRNPWAEFWRLFARNRLAVAGLVFLVAVSLVAALAPVLPLYAPDYIELGQRLKPPSERHPLGTDETGRDVLSRLVWGGRVTLTIGLVAMLLSLAVGTLVGALAGFFGGWVDAVLMRLTDGMLSIPIFFLLLTVLASLGATVPNLVMAVGLASWMPTARVVRGEALRAITMEYVSAARALGAGNARVLFRHVLPQAYPSIIVASTLSIAQAILTESALSYLGLGVQPPTPSWGNMLSGAQQYVWTAPLLALWPGLLILLAVLGYNALGDALRDALDPFGREP